MTNKIKIIGALVAMSIYSSAYAEGVQLSRTRILFNDGVTKVSYGLTNHSEKPILASAIISNFDGSSSNSFAVSPSLYQVKPKKTHQGQIILLNPLPKDKESVFWLTVKTVSPKIEAQGQSSNMEIALAQNIKVFYRPKGLNETCKTGLNHISWEMTKGGIKANNAAKVSFSIVNVKDINNKIYKIGDTVLPKTTKEWSVDHKGLKIASFTYVDEYGNYIEQMIGK